MVYTRKKKLYKTRKTKTRKTKKNKTNKKRRQNGGDIRTIMKHISDFDESTSKPGLFFSLNEENIAINNRVLVIGPRYPKQKENDYKEGKYPYEECLFFFNMGFPNDYPNTSPNLKFMNAFMFTDNFRYHPNLYEGPSGKVCLSILGTWAGPGWRNDMNIESTLTTIQSLLGPNPIHNEPAYEGTRNINTLSNYNHAACYRSIKFTIDIYKKILANSSIHENIEPFIEDIKKRIFSSLKFFIKKLANLKRHHSTKFSVSTIHHRIVIDYDELYDEVIQLNINLPPELQVDIIDENTSVKHEENMEALALAERLRSIGWNRPRNNLSKAKGNDVDEDENEGNGEDETEYVYENEDEDEEENNEGNS
jgi:ubiquitin-protein ligase